MFLESLRRQTYQNFVLVVTIFREQNVERNVRKILGGGGQNKTVFIYSQVSEEYRYSPTQVVLNGIAYGMKNGYDILFDCSGDIILQDNMLEVVDKRFSPMYSGISHPNIFHEVDGDFQVVSKSIGSCSRGIDVRFFDLQLLNHSDIKEKLKNYALYDWGGIEHLLFGISQQYSDEMINIYEESKVVKIENDRESANENNEYIRKSAKRNWQVLEELAIVLGIDYADLMDLFYIHAQYKMTKHRVRNFIALRKQWKPWIIQRIKKRGGRFSKILSIIVDVIL